MAYMMHHCCRGGLGGNSTAVSFLDFGFSLFYLSLCLKKLRLLILIFLLRNNALLQQRLFAFDLRLPIRQIGLHLL